MKSTPRVTPYSESLRFFGCLDFLEDFSDDADASLAFFEGGGGEEGAFRFLVVVEGKGSGVSVLLSSPRCVARTARRVRVRSG